MITRRFFLSASVAALATPFISRVVQDVLPPAIVNDFKPWDVFPPVVNVGTDAPRSEIQKYLAIGSRGRDVVLQKYDPMTVDREVYILGRKPFA